MVFLSALKALEERKILEDVVEWWGTSAGAFLAVMFALSGSVDVLKKVMRQTQFSKFRDVNVLNLVNLNSVWGMDDGISMVTEVGRIMEILKPGSSTYTLSKIPGLHIFVTDIDDHKVIDCCAKNYPNMAILDALRASMSLPIFYTPFLDSESGHHWIDGGLAANFPWNQLKTEAEKKESLGFSFERTWMNGPRTFNEYIFAMSRFGEPKNILTLKSDWPQNILWFPSPPFPAWFMNLQEEEFCLLETLGLQAFENWFTRRQLCSKTPETHPLSAPHCIPEQVCQLNHTGGMLDTPRCSCRQQPTCPPQSQDLQPQIPRPSRRWSW